MWFDQALERIPRSVGRAGIPEKPPVVMCGEDDPEQLEGELPRVRLGSEMSFVDGEADYLGDRAAQLAPPGDKQVAHGTRPIVVFEGSGEHEGAARGFVVPFDPLEPVREQRPQTGDAGRRLLRRTENGFLETQLHLLERLELQVLLRAEV